MNKAFAGLCANRQFVVAELKLAVNEFKANGKQRWNKIPIDAGGHPLTWNNSNNLLTYEESLSRMSSLKSLFPHRQWGIGYIFTPDDGYVFIDLDDCLGADNNWNSLASKVISYFPGAAVEVSSSGAGLHIIFKATSVIKNKCKNSQHTIEVYTGTKFMMFGHPNAIGDCDSDHTTAFRQFINDYMLDSETPQTGIGDLWRTWEIALLDGCHTSCTPIQSDIELLAAIKRAGQTPDVVFAGEQTKFNKLWEGDITGYPSHSEADAALASILAWWTGNHVERIERFMWQSGLVRDKWNRADYLPRTLLFARGKQTTFYSSKRGQDTSQVLRATSSLRSYYPEQNANNKIINSTTNLDFLLQYLNIKARWNDMKHERELIIPEFTPHKGDSQNASLCRVTDLAAFHEFPITRIDEQLNLIAQRDTYHPLVECIQKCPWDGILRLQTFIETIKTDGPFSQLLIRKWMLSTMGSVHSVFGWAQQGVLVLQGSQGLQKTRFIKALDPIGCGAVREGAILDTNNKDHVITFSKHAIVEIAELDGTLRKNDVARLKAFITSDSDEVRFPYARKNTVLPRRTSYIATVNDCRFLTDTTGNRRFHVIPVEDIIFDHGLDMQQVWAEVEFYRQGGELTWLSKEDSILLNTSNENYEQINSLEDRVLDYFDWESDWKITKNMMEVTCSKVLQLLGLKIESNSLATRVSYILNNHGFRSSKRRHYLVPPPKKTT